MDEDLFLAVYYEHLARCGPLHDCLRGEFQFSYQFVNCKTCGALYQCKKRITYGEPSPAVQTEGKSGE